MKAYRWTDEEGIEHYYRNKAEAVKSLRESLREGNTATPLYEIESVDGVELLNKMSYENRELGFTIDKLNYKVGTLEETEEECNRLRKRLADLQKTQKEQ